MMRCRYFLVVLLSILVADRALGQSCPLCFDNSSPPDLSFVPPDSFGQSCGDLLLSANLGFPGVTCNEWVIVGLLCGCPKPPGGCNLCFDGSQPPDLAFVPDGFGGGNCIQLVAAAGDPNPTEESPTCDEWLVSGLFCSCPKPANACTLCEDGSDLPNPSQKVGSDDCQAAEAMATFSEGDVCKGWQGGTGVYCGCDNPIASQDYCRVCGGDTLLPDSTIVAYIDSDGTPVTCAAVERNLDEIACETLQNNYAGICCPGMGAFPPKKSPGQNTSKDDSAKLFGGEDDRGGLDRRTRRLNFVRGH